jgi:hypothetical protein
MNVDSLERSTVTRLTLASGAGADSVPKQGLDTGLIELV